MSTAKKVESQEYAATYKGGKFGKSVVHVVAPQITKEESLRRFREEVMPAAWACWDTLTTKEKLQVNAECEAGLLE
ncbi:MAG: hypothetical protein H6Q72_913 [Firmicutes bacterium]|nr:hypothetical protein [Bacillota bacterium]